MTPPAYGRVERKAAPGGISKRVRLAPHLVESKDEQSTEVAPATADGYEDIAPGLWLPGVIQSYQYKGRAFAPAGDRFLGRAVKRLIDVTGALLLALLFSPLMIAVSVWLCCGRGGVAYRHKRVGAGGKLFDCLKFRTMVPDAERSLHELLASNEDLKAEWLRGHKLRNDPRVTPIGRFLRRTSLDELPQLWNVLRGEMSLVGPRPVVREELLRYGRNSLAYLAVKPGITGLWQTMGRNDTDYRRRVAMDVYYVRNQTVLFDVYILAKTVRVVLAGDGAY